MAKVLKGNFPRGQGQNETRREDEAVVPGYQLKLAVAFSDPLIWRRIRVPGKMTLGTLHKAIQVCMGWDDTDTHQFLVGKIFYQAGFGIREMQKREPEYDENRFQLYQLEEGMQFLFTYLYDGGEGWELEITLETIIPEGIQEKCPILVAGERACPPVEIGDIHTYQALLSAAETAAEESGVAIRLPDYPDFDSEHFDIETTQRHLSAIT